MNRKSTTVRRLRICLLVFCTAATAHAQTAWHDSLASAEAAAARDQVPMLIHFHAWYCAPCRQMDSQVFHHSDIQDALSQGLHAVQIDVTRNPDAAAQYQATTVPRDVVVYPDGTIETLNIGFVSRSRYLALLKGTASRGLQMRDEGVPLPSSPKQAIAADNPDTRRTEVATSEVDESDSTSQRTLGLDGYCPVCLTKNRQWVKGNSELSFDYRGVTYFFAEKEDQTEFAKDPGKYAPKNLGCDPVLLYQDQRAISGRIQYGAFFDGSLFLFSSNDNRALFRENPLRYTRIRHAVRIDQVENRRVL